jgi:glucosamine-6-phosphate deaminase
MQLKTCRRKDYGMPVTESRRFRCEKLNVEVCSSREHAAAAAAEAAAREIKRLEQEKATISVIFATGASQLSTLRALTAIADMPWDRIEGFHMDEYAGISPEHRASFRRYMRTELTEKVTLLRFHEINGNAASAEQECREYGTALRLARPQLCLVGIGENGHLALRSRGCGFRRPSGCEGG